MTMLLLLLLLVRLFVCAHAILHDKFSKLTHAHQRFHKSHAKLEIVQRVICVNYVFELL